MCDVACRALREPRDEHAGLVEPRVDQVAVTVAHEIVVGLAPRRDRDFGAAGSGRPTEPIFLPDAFRAPPTLRSRRRARARRPDRSARSAVATSSGRMPEPANKRTGVFLAGDHRRVDEPAAHLAGVVDDVLTP